MPPGLLTSEVGLSFPPLSHQKRMDESLFPPIARKSAISLSSETDPSDYCNGEERKIHTRGSVPASLSSSPVKFPTIDRANSTSVASLPGSRSTRHRSNMRDLRSSYCRSPSCPSHLDISREFNHSVEYNLVQSDRGPRSDLDNSEDLEDSFSKLPNIFSKDIGGRFMDGKANRGRDKNRDKLSQLSLRRSESFMRTLSHANVGNTHPLSNRENEPRQNQAAALLLPIRTNPQTNKKKKKRRQKVSSDSEGETSDNTPRNEDLNKRLSGERDGDDALNAIARENDLYEYEDDLDSTPRAIEISSSRKVKQWMNNNQKETGQIKA